MKRWRERGCEVDENPELSWHLGRGHFDYLFEDEEFPGIARYEAALPALDRDGIAEVVREILAERSAR